MSAIPLPQSVPTPRPKVVIYPESDGKPMADNTLQYDWIRRIQGNLAILYRDDPNTFVAGDLLWYPVEGFPEIRVAPDVLVAFGRPKGYRGSYLQWEEEGVAPQVVFEILSPSNDHIEMEEKYDWYEEHGVEEYYEFDPRKPNKLRVFLRDGAILRPKKPPHGFVSPRMGIRFDLSGPDLVIHHPDGRPFLSVEQIDLLRAEATKDAANARKEADEANRVMKRLKELGPKARRGEASAEELAELQRLESEP